MTPTLFSLNKNKLSFEKSRSTSFDHKSGVPIIRSKFEKMFNLRLQNKNVVLSIKSYFRDSSKIRKQN